MRAAAANAFNWLDERLPLRSVMEFAGHKTVPVHRLSVIYYFGGMTLFFFMV
jgi:quinol-cytochrome oxidoreductase complex cytochrome b subunit